MRIILLGGTGFIGNRLANLLQPLAQVVVLSRLLPCAESMVANVQYIQGDVANKSDLSSIFREDDYVIFLAYHFVSRTTFTDPFDDMKGNLPMAFSLLDTLRNVSIKKLIYISSGGTVYGECASRSPISELHETNPISYYGITKLAIEKALLMYHHLFDIPVIIARPSNPYGPGQIPNRAQGFIATALSNIHSGREINIYGGNDSVRDYIYIDDLVSGIISLLQDNVQYGSIYNIGSGIGLGNLDAIQFLATELDVPVSSCKINMFPPRYTDVSYNVLDNTRILKTGWSPKVDFEEGLKRTTRWLIDRKENC